MKAKLMTVVVVLCYKVASLRERPAIYLSRDVRNQGIWRGWRNAGLEHLSERAMIRFCGFPLAIVFQMADGISKDPEMASLNRESRYWKRLDPSARPLCDALDVVVLVLREMATMGYQHQLCTDLGIPSGSLGKYLVRGKKALLFIKGHRGSRMELLSKEHGDAAHYALEAQFGPCPRTGIKVPYAIDGTVLAMHKPQDEELALRFYSGAKRMSAVNILILMAITGEIIAFRGPLQGNISDARGAEAIMQMILDIFANPHLFGVLVDYGFAEYCHNEPDLAPIVRPYAPTKDTLPDDSYLQNCIADLSRWVCSARQCNEWLNGSAKRGFPRMSVRTDVRHLDRLTTDLDLYLHLYNYRVRMCDWSQCRTVFLGHALRLFEEQGLVYDEEYEFYDVGADGPMILYPDVE